ncbi:MAG: response regulator [Brumimicrobium sp.]|nr:response regulator [Brumimicrobium sp.]MCO5268600.1 response regulator [Brumimicrobium sp.]
MKERPILLIVEDELDIKILYKSILKQHFDFEIMETDSVRGTTDVLKKCIPDYVLLDLCLPDGDGYQIMPLLREVNPNVRVLVISAFNCGQERKKVEISGAMGLLAKPFEKEQFIQHIQQLINV